MGAASAALGADLLRESLRAFEASAAAVAASQWLRAAAEVADEASDTEWTDVVEESDNISARPTAIPNHVLEMLALGLSPREATSTLTEEALSVTSGRHPDPSTLVLALQEALDDEDATDDNGAKLTLLDPTRPTLDLLEDLLTGIEAAFEWWREYQPADADAATLSSDDVPGDDDEWTEAQEAELLAAHEAAFVR